MTDADTVRAELRNATDLLEQWRRSGVPLAELVDYQARLVALLAEMSERHPLSYARAALIRARAKLAELEANL